LGPLARFIAADERIAQWAGKRSATAFLYEFVRFGLKQSWACLFGATPQLARYLSEI
jgi:hypothetical protein